MSNNDPSNRKGIVLKHRETGEKLVYLHCIALVHTYHPEDGTPALVTFIREDQTVNLAGGEHFVEGFMNAASFAGRGNEAKEDDSNR